MKICCEIPEVIQIGISVYAKLLTHFQQCVESCLKQEGVEWILTIRADGIITNEIKDYIKGNGVR